MTTLLYIIAGWLLLALVVGLFFSLLFRNRPRIIISPPESHELETEHEDRHGSERR